MGLSSGKGWEVCEGRGTGEREGGARTKQITRSRPSALWKTATEILTSPKILQATKRCHPKRAAKDTVMWGHFSELLSSWELLLTLFGLNYFSRKKMRDSKGSVYFMNLEIPVLWSTPWTDTADFLDSGPYHPGRDAAAMWQSLEAVPPRDPNPSSHDSSASSPSSLPSAYSPGLQCCFMNSSLLPHLLCVWKLRGIPALHSVFPRAQSMALTQLPLTYPNQTVENLLTASGCI